MTTQPEAMRLAGALLEPVVLDKHAMQAADELLRLHAECEALSSRCDRLDADLDDCRDKRDALHAECEALRATQSDTLLRLLCDLRFALGDNGARMQHDLVEYARGLRADAERLDSGCIVTHERDEFGEEYLCERRGLDLRAAIDAARAAKEQSK